MIITDNQVVMLRTHKGVPLYQFLASDQTKLTWSRDARQVSTCNVTVDSLFENGRLPDIVPWLHWIDVWDPDANQLLWSGPITEPTMDRNTMDLAAVDIAALFEYTRVPMTKQWEAADPADIAEELVAAMVELHDINTRAVVYRDPLGDRFDFSTEVDSGMLQATIGDLVNLGLRWTVVAGTPILGPVPRKPVAALGEYDFVGGGIRLTRSGKGMFNDVLLRSGDSKARARVERNGLNLQTLVNIDSMFGVSNTERAVQQYARYTASARNSLTLPQGSVLHPDAPVSMDQLIPFTRFTVEAYGLLTLMELTTVDVTCSPGTIAVAVTLTSVDDDPPELVKVQQQNSLTGGV